MNYIELRNALDRLIEDPTVEVATVDLDLSPTGDNEITVTTTLIDGKPTVTIDNIG